MDETKHEQRGRDGESVKERERRRAGVRCVLSQTRGGVWQKPRLIHSDCRAERMLNPQRARGREGGRDRGKEKTGTNRENKRETDCKEWMWRCCGGAPLAEIISGPRADVPGQFTVGRAVGNMTSRVPARGWEGLVSGWGLPSLATEEKVPPFGEFTFLLSPVHPFVTQTHGLLF